MRGNPGISVLPAYPQMLSQPILGRKNIRSGPPLSALRRSPRLHPNLSQEIATRHPISSAPYIQANDDNKSSKAANSNNNSSVKQIRSLEDAAITQGNPMETAPRSNYKSQLPLIYSCSAAIIITYFFTGTILSYMK